MTRRHSWSVRILAILVFAQFCGIMYINWTKAYGVLQMDSALALRHGVEMWKNGIFLPNFSYFSTMEIDCAGFLAAPVYMLTGSLGLAMCLSQAMMYALTVYVLFDLAKNTEASIGQFLMMVLLLYTPYSVEQLDWAQMLFISVAQYGFRMLLMLLMLDLMLMGEKEEKNRVKFLILLAFCLLLNFWTSLSTGNFVLCMIVLPMIIGYGLNCVLRQSFRLKSWANVTLILNGLASYAACSLRGDRIGDLWRNRLSLIKASQFSDNVDKAISGVFQLFGGLTLDEKVSVFSIQGIGILLRFGFFVLILVVVVSCLIRTKKWPALFGYLSAVFVVDFGILLVTDTSYSAEVFEYRYHIPWTIVFLAAAGFVLFGEMKGKNPVLEKAVRYLGLCVLAVINLTGFCDLQNIDQVNENKGYERTILTIAEENDADCIFIYGRMETPAILRGLDLDKYCTYVSYDRGYMDIRIYDNYLAYNDNSRMEGSNILICSEEQFLRLPEFMRKLYTLVDTETFGGEQYVYYAEKSVWDGTAGLPLLPDTVSVDFPYTPGYAYTGTIGLDGVLIADSPESGFVLYGPNSKAVEGTYNITLFYRVLEKGDREAFFDVSSDSGQNVVMRGNLPDDAEKFTFENVVITGNALLEYRVWKPEDAVISIEKIVFERIE